MTRANVVFLSIASAIVLLVVSSCQKADTTPTAPATGSVQSIAAASNKGGNDKDKSYGVGGVKVDSDCNFCNGDFEDNTIAPGLTMVVWLNNPQPNWCNSYSYTIADKGQNFVGPTGLGFYIHSCNHGYREYHVTAPASTPFGGSDSVTLTVWCDDTGTSIGSDSFRLIDNGDCEK